MSKIHDGCMRNDAGFLNFCKHGLSQKLLDLTTYHHLFQRFWDGFAEIDTNARTKRV